MADAFKTLYQGRPANTTTTLYTVPSTATAIIKHIRVTNPTGATHTIKLWHGGTADTNIILPTASIESGGWAEFDGTITAESDSVFSGVCDAASTLVVTIYGDEVS